VLVVVLYQSQVFLNKTIHSKQVSIKEIIRMHKRSTVFVFSLFFAVLLLSMSALVFSSVQAQGDATVVVSTATGGATDVTGTTTYPDGTSFNITATSIEGYAFVQWIISTDSGSTNYFDNPLTITLSGGTTYTIQPSFQVILAPPSGTIPNQLATAAIVVVLGAAGGSTSPAPGTYAVADATTMKLNATANSGWQFSHWTISGSPTTHGGYPVNFTPTDNPYTVGHGYGYTYYYQPVFTPVGNPGSTATPTASPAGTIAGMSSETWIIIVLVIVIIAMAIGFTAYALRRKK
jgi:hypothetical protein